MTQSSTLEHIMEHDILFEVSSPLGFRVRITRGYWEFIVTVKHPVMRERVTEVQEVLQTPDEIRQSRSDPAVFLFYQAAKQHLKALLSDVEELFVTPKPEGLVERILQIASDADDWVLDSFAGTGTTGTAAHKMRRKWIMVELGEHCRTHILPRLRKVIDGKDIGGINERANWQGGGGFRYYRLGPSLIVEDAWGNPVINPAFNAAMLAEALCKLEGFTY